jgi:hypothetical protein
MSDAGREALAVLTPPEQNFLVLHARGGLSDEACRKLGLARDEIPRELARIKAKLERAARSVNGKEPLVEIIERRPEPAVELEPARPAKGADELLAQHQMSRIVDYLRDHGAQTAPAIAEGLGNAVTRSNAARCLRQLEDARVVRRAGLRERDGSGGRPAVIWTLTAAADQAAAPRDPIDTDEETVQEPTLVAGGEIQVGKPIEMIGERLIGPARPFEIVVAAPDADLRTRYFEVLLAMVGPDCPEHVYDRLERLALS